MVSTFWLLWIMLLWILEYKNFWVLAFGSLGYIPISEIAGSYGCNSAQARARGATPRPRSRAAAERSYLTSKERWLHRSRRAERSCSTFKVRRGGCEELLLLQGKEQRLRFAGAATKRYPTSKLRETQIRWKVLQEGIRGQTHWNHTHRKLVSLITLGPQPCLTQWN